MTMMTPSPMRADIARQPDMLAAFAARAEGFAALGRKVLAPGDGGRLWITGCGDGLFAAIAASRWATECGLDWRPIGAMDMVLAANRLRPSDRVIAISMSGNVDRTVEAARAVAAAGVTMLALVNGNGGRLGEIAGAKISLDLADIAPFLCGTASYTATLTALLALAAGAASCNPPDLAAPIAAQRAALAASDGAFAGLAVPTGVRVLSAGNDIGTAQYGSAKFVELTRIPAWSGELEEFAHSQYWAMPTQDLVVVLAGDAALAAYADESCAALGELGVATLAIDTLSTPVVRATRHITLPDVPPSLFALAACVPLQILASTLARASGLDPDTRTHLKSDGQRFKVSRMLTRRSLLGTGA
ncbi:MAG: SIS domain-containing protein [Rhodospirillales bacterium]|jgi:fructoselysine-6-P-deglycase FrlB-like protein